MHQRQIRSTDAVAALEHVRGVVAGYPEVDEAVDGFGHTSFRVRDKPFVIMGESGGGPSLSVKAEPFAQRHLIDTGDFVRTKYIGQHGWVSLAECPPEEWTVVDDLIVDGYLLVAPKALAKQVRNGLE